MSTDRIRVGLIGKPFGLLGHVTVRVESDDPERFAVGTAFPGPDGSDIVIDDQRDAEKGIVLRFAGFTTREQAETLRGHELTIDPDERRQLAADEFWPDELVGLDVISQTGERIGVVTAFVEGSAQDRLAVKPPEGSVFEIPFVAALVPVVDIDAGTITINAIPGLTEQ